MAPTAPAPLDEGHRLDNFECVSPALARWLRERAYQNQVTGASRCFVVCDDSMDVVGYYALAAGSVSHAIAPGRVRRNMPEPVPVVVLGRLAVHDAWVGQGIGGGLLKDAILRSLRAAEHLGIRALLCHAIDDDARRFYLGHGFIESPIDPMTLMVGLDRVKEALGK